MVIIKKMKLKKGKTEKMLLVKRRKITCGATEICKVP